MKTESKNKHIQVFRGVVYTRISFAPSLLVP